MENSNPGSFIGSVTPNNILTHPPGMSVLQRDKGTGNWTWRSIPEDKNKGL